MARLSIEERFWPKVQKTETCWLWAASLDGKGYGQINSGVPPWRPRRAHVVAYEICVGPVPEGLELDHLCRNRTCVNPAHLEPVTHAENLRRGARKTGVTHCPQGHAYDLANTRMYQGRRYCRECHRLRMIVWNAKQKGQRRRK